MSTISADRVFSLEPLAPQIKLKTLRILNDCVAHGLRFRPFETFRTDERQAYLYAQGRTRPGNIVTNARSSRFSWHGYAVAVDWVWLTTTGSWTWEVAESRWQELERICNKYDMVTGRLWKNPRDAPHVQPKNCPKSPDAKTVALFGQGGLQRVWRYYGWI